MKYLLKCSSLLILIFVFNIIFSTYACAEEEYHAKTDLDILKFLDLYPNSSKIENPEGYFNSSLNRMQAACLLLRLNGLLVEASNYKIESDTENFVDADNISSDIAIDFGDGKRILAYLKNHPELGWQGVGNNKFKPEEKITAQQYYKVILTTLGYNTGSDFTYNNTLEFAKSKGLRYAVPEKEINHHRFAEITVEALQAKLKDGSKSFAEKLVEEGKMNPQLTSSGLD